MQKVAITSAAAFSLLLAVVIAGYAQHGQEGQKQEGQKQEGQKQDHALRQQERHQQEQGQQQRPSDQQSRRTRSRAVREQERHDRAQQQRPTDRPTQVSQELGRSHENRQPTQERRQSDRNRQPSQHPSQQGRNEHPQPARQSHLERSGWQQHRAHRWESEHRTWQQRGGYRGYRIPDDRFRGYFGPEHGFRVNGLPFLVVGGYPRFQYSGYWVSALDPWPEYWGDNWYDNDDVYVAYVDHGYYLFNRRYPRSGIAISISL
jgi:hypothetical protein